MKKLILTLAIVMTSLSMASNNSVQPSDDFQNCAKYARAAFELEAAHDPTVWPEQAGIMQYYYELCEEYGDSLGMPVFV